MARIDPSKTTIPQMLGVVRPERAAAGQPLVSRPDADVQSGGSVAAVGAGASSTATAKGGCRCGRCPACAARSYGAMQPTVAASAVAESPPPEQPGSVAEPAPQSREAEATPAESGRERSGPKKPDGTTMTQAEELEVAQLKQVDTKVRAHEMAHLAAAGPYARGGASFQYQKGPDGMSYAVGGEVPIDTGREATPEKTIAKMEQVRAAALAPADPSPQDRQVAAQAGVAITEATQEQQLVALEEAKQEAARSAKKDSGSLASASPPPQGRSISLVI